MSLDPCGNQLVIGNTCGEVFLWELATDEANEIKRFNTAPLCKNVIRHISFSSDASIMILASDSSEIFIFNRKNNEI